MEWDLLSFDLSWCNPTAVLKLTAYFPCSPSARVYRKKISMLIQMRTYSMSAIVKLTKHDAIFHFISL